jgi:thiamine kinase-like enzyme
LPAEDRIFLRSAYRTVVESIGNDVLENRALHGECNPQQIISTPTGLVWLDFEAACLGPREWDLATMDGQTVESYGTVDLSLLSLLKTARLLCVTTWCWTQPDRDPEIREAAQYHLEYLKRRRAIRPR